MKPSPFTARWVSWDLPIRGLPSSTTPTLTLRVHATTQVLDGMRAAVVDGFYSVPHDGVEVGGVLYGIDDGKVVSIRAFRRLECEHKLGPSFTLSDHDLIELQKLMEPARPSHEPHGTGKNHDDLIGLRVVGWFHAHTRSDLRFTEQDQELHQRLFSGARQVALVLRPAHLRPTRAGWFLAAGERPPQPEPVLEFVVEDALNSAEEDIEVPAGGSDTERGAEPPKDFAAIQSTEPLPPAPLRANSAANPLPLKPDAEANLSPASVGTVPLGITPSREVPETPGFLRDHKPDPIGTNSSCLEQPPRRTWWKSALWFVAGILFAAALVAGGVYTFQPEIADFLAGESVRATVQGSGTDAARSQPLGLDAVQIGDLLILHWNRKNPAAQRADSGLLNINDGGVAINFSLDRAALSRGGFRYQRTSVNTVVKLTLKLADDTILEDSVNIEEPLPAHQPTPEEAQAVTQRDALRVQLNAAKAEIQRTQARNRLLQSTLNSAIQQLRESRPPQ